MALSRQVYCHLIGACASPHFICRSKVTNACGRRVVVGAGAPYLPRCHELAKACLFPARKGSERRQGRGGKGGREGERERKRGRGRGREGGKEGGEKKGAGGCGCARAWVQPHVTNWQKQVCDQTRARLATRAFRALVYRIFWCMRLALRCFECALVRTCVYCMFVSFGWVSESGSE